MTAACGRKPAGADLHAVDPLHTPGAAKSPLAEHLPSSKVNVSAHHIRAMAAFSSANKTLQTHYIYKQPARPCICRRVCCSAVASPGWSAVGEVAGAVSNSCLAGHHGRRTHLTHPLNLLLQVLHQWIPQMAMCQPKATSSSSGNSLHSLSTPAGGLS